MLKMKKILSFCLVLLLVVTAFRGLSITVEAVSTTFTYNVTVTNVDNNYIDSDIYHVAPGTDVTFEVYITNNTGKSLYDSSTVSNIADGDIYHKTVNMAAQPTYIMIPIQLEDTSVSPLKSVTVRIYIVWDGVAPAPSGGSNSSSSEEKSDDIKPHTHSYYWEDTVEATENTDGEIVYRCECGDILYRVPKSAYYVFNKNTMDKIKNAKQGETVKIETSKWISFHKMVMQALADRPDVTLEVSFLDGEYKGNRVSFTIPAGTDTMALVDDNGYSGFLYLAGQFGLISN
ncbi:hypothetical protein [Butyrivibrio sp. TB]|uniref:hypothetical protein n=1 Tax=Butyrivibrio sp. TB TaxID=1520809 RepID=UPI0008B83CF1|nr:hypothetical protein [Butyrivibrio sp. TB]SEQ60068.1 hypothetical protein SAMN02910382_03540 [Butyrivibrio sp. TB]